MYMTVESFTFQQKFHAFQLKEIKNKLVETNFPFADVL